MLGRRCERETVHDSRCRQEPIDRILVRECDETTLNGDLMIEQRLLKRDGLEHLPNPGQRVRFQDHTAFFRQHQDLPYAER